MITFLKHPQIRKQISNSQLFIPHIFVFFLFYVLFAVDIPCVLFVFIYDYVKRG